ASLTVHNPVFWLRLCAMGDLGFSEAFMYGEVACDDLVKVFSIFIANRTCLAALDTPLTRLLRVPSRFAAARLVNSVANARSNISAHYDISNDMFKGFLSRDMTYSCAIFPDLDGDLALSPKLASDDAKSTTGTSTPSTLAERSPDVHELGFAKQDKTLERLSTVGAQPQDRDPLYDAQIRKLQHIIRKADIRPGHRVLEIGSGWGSLSILIASTISETTVDTLTLSTQQAALARERITAAGLGDGKDPLGRVRVHLMDYRNMPPEWKGTFDRVVSVEMVEAVGHEYMQTYWEKIDWALNKDTGVGVIQGITIPEARFDAYLHDTDFIQKWVLFPGGFLPSVSLLVDTLARASHGRLVVESIANIGPHYARTLREWRQRFEASFEDVVVPALMKEHPGVMGGEKGREEIEVFKRKWLYYFCYCEVGFTHRMLGDHIITFTREANVEYGCQIFD
ncbi:S-adenosyl-L-methionine-dependent methyltransferase, partial [Amylocystis lapponica]